MCRARDRAPIRNGCAGWDLSGSRIAFSFDDKPFKEAADYEQEIGALLEMSGPKKERDSG